LLVQTPVQTALQRDEQAHDTQVSPVSVDELQQVFVTPPTTPWSSWPDRLRRVSLLSESFFCSFFMYVSFTEMRCRAEGSGPAG
jgi:hypothetical protein